MEFQLPKQWPVIFGGVLNPAESARYAPQLEMLQWGHKAQEKLKLARIFIAGAGGLATALATYLVAAGVGRLRIVDSNKIALQNLHCQLFYREKDLGKAKAVIAEKRLREVNSFVDIEGMEKNITEQNVLKLTEGFDLLINGLNNPLAQRILNWAAVQYQLPLIHATIGGMSGSLTTFWPGRGPCLECVLTNLPPTEAPGVLAPLTGIFGSLQAHEALMIAGGLGPALLGRLIEFDGRLFHFVEKRLSVNPACLICRHLSS
jgi:molybdopterin/thiamine biosynthesis adenylyltransferase